LPVNIPTVLQTLIHLPFICLIFSETLDNLFFTLRLKPLSILKLRIAGSLPWGLSNIAICVLN